MDLKCWLLPFFQKSNHENWREEPKSKAKVITIVLVHIHVVDRQLRVRYSLSNTQPHNKQHQQDAGPPQRLCHLSSSTSAMAPNHGATAVAVYYAPSLLSRISLPRHRWHARAVAVFYAPLLSSARESGVLGLRWPPIDGRIQQPTESRLRR